LNLPRKSLEHYLSDQLDERFATHFTTLFGCLCPPHDIGGFA
jgi:hypothetical protein